MQISCHPLFFTHVFSITETISTFGGCKVIFQFHFLYMDQLALLYKFSFFPSFSLVLFIFFIFLFFSFALQKYSLYEHKDLKKINRVRIHNYYFFFFWCSNCLIQPLGAPSRQFLCLFISSPSLINFFFQSVLGHFYGFWYKVSQALTLKCSCPSCG